MPEEVVKWVCSADSSHVFDNDTEDHYCPLDPPYHGFLERKIIKEIAEKKIREEQEDFIHSEQDTTEVSQTDPTVVSQEIISNPIPAPVISSNQSISIPPPDLTVEIPKINKFSANSYVLKRGEHFSLSWQVEKATTIEIYKNGVFDTKHNVNQLKVDKVALDEKGRRKATYVLIAANEYGTTKSDPIVIFIEEKKPFLGKKALVLSISALVFVCLLALLLSRVLFDNDMKRIVVSEVKPKQVYGRSPIVVYGKNFPENLENVQVLLNGVSGIIGSHSKDSMVVGFPKTANASYWAGTVRIAMVVDKDTLPSLQQVFVFQNIMPLDTASSKNGQVETLAHERSSPMDSITAEKNKAGSTDKKTTDEKAIKERRKREELKRKEELRRKEEAKKKEDARVREEARKRESERREDSLRKVEAEKALRAENQRKEREKVVNLVKVTSKSDPRFFGGLKNIKVTVTNNSDHEISNVRVTVSYEKNNRVTKEEILTFPTVGAHSSTTQNAPNGEAKKISVRLESLSVKDID